jgi:hypothetical protein
MNARLAPAIPALPHNQPAIPHRNWFVRHFHGQLQPVLIIGR